MKRRDLNPGDVFVYVELPDAGTFWGDYWIGRPLYVPGVDPWLEGAEPSDTFNHGPETVRALLDSPVVLLKKPDGRICERQAVRNQLDSVITELVELRDSI